MDDKLDETEFLYFEHPEHNPQSIKDLVEDMIQNFDKNQDKVSFNFIYFPFFNFPFLSTSLSQRIHYASIIYT